MTEQKIGEQKVLKAAANIRTAHREAAAASRVLTRFMVLSMRIICLTVILGLWPTKRGLGAKQGPRYPNSDR